MPKHKQKIIVNEELAESQKLPARIPIGKPTVFHTDKSKYDRKREKNITE